MNFVHYEVDMHGGLLPLDPSSHDIPSPNTDLNSVKIRLTNFVRRITGRQEREEENE